jgi:hypothetical protein
MSARPLVHALVRDLFHVPGLRARFAETPSQVLDGYDLTQAERDALLDGSFPALHALGMHPLAQMVYGLARNPGMAEMISARDYLADLD